MFGSFFKSGNLYMPAVQTKTLLLIIRDSQLHYVNTGSDKVNCYISSGESAMLDIVR